MRNYTIILTCLLFLSSCKILQPATSNPISCTNCPSERLEFWNRWLNVCAPGNTASSLNADWSQTTFRTVGVTYEGFATKDSLTHANMVSFYPADSIAKKYLPGIILSGSDYPNQVVIKKGEYLTKLVKIGANISGFSVYYITPEELKQLKLDPSRLEQKLGLPLTSNTNNYLVYRIHALDDNVVFQSHVAPTIQYSSPNKAVYWTTGGATQTLVLNSNDKAHWKKESLPSDTLKIEVLPYIDQNPNY